MFCLPVAHALDTQEILEDQAKSMGLEDLEELGEAYTGEVDLTRGLDLKEVLTNLYHRGGKAGADWAKAAAKKLLPRPAMARIAELDEAFMERNLSPGGCADLLAATLFLHKLDKTGAAG